MTHKKKDLHGLKGLIRGAEGILEIAVLTLLYYYIWRSSYPEGTFPTYYGLGKYVLSGVYGLLTVVLLWNFEGFKFGYLKTTDVLVSQWIAVLMANFITYWQLCLIANVMITPVPMLILTALDFTVCAVCSYVYSHIYHYIYVPKNMLMVYGREDAILLKLKMDARFDKYNITKLIHESAGVEAVCREIGNFDAVILTDITAENRNDILKYCYQHEVRTYVAPKLSDIIFDGGRDITLFDTPLRLVKGKGLAPMQRLCKRLMDIALSLIAVVVALPILLIVSVAIKLEDGGPVFYKQKRATIGGKEFNILKFRSMIVDAEKDGKSIPAIDGDPRITKVGKIIRATRIDELPQLLNILKGDMSIVGPRPERVEHVEEYTRELPEFAYRLKVKGGLTGYARIYGEYNTSAYDKLRLDLMYIENYTFMLDIKLILMTVRVMFSKDSTEGFDKAEELEAMKRQVLTQMEEDSMVGSGK